MTQGFDAEGVVETGEVTTRVMREALTLPDHNNAVISGAVGAYSQSALWVQQRIDQSGPYDDVRPLRELLVWIADKIREVQSPATMEY